MTFASLHTHTHASMLDASSKPEDLAAKAKQLGMPAMAITDHGNLFNAVPFYLACKKEGVKPILGVEFNFVEDASEATAIKNRRVQHVVLLAENYTGWQNLCKLVIASNTEKYFWFKPRIDYGLLEKHSEGLIMLTSCVGGIVASYLSDRLDEEGDVMARKSVFRAEATLRRLLRIFDKDHIFLEVQDNGQSQQHEVNSELRRLGTKFGLRTVATLNVHYTNEEDAEAHGALQSMRGEFSVLSASDFSDSRFALVGRKDLADRDFLPEELDVTLEIAERCNVEIDFGEHRLPSYPYVPEGETATDMFKRLVREGALAKGLDKKPNANEYRQRLVKEMQDISDMGFEDYFLIVWDVVAWVQDQGILVGPGRGSAGGSLVSYCLGITDIDPLQYGLIWERFLNRGRKSLPDIDTDIPRSKRGLVLEYVRERFGVDNVSQLATFNQLAARAVLKDVFRVYGVPFDEANRVTSCIPLKSDDHGKITLADAIESVPSLQAFEDQYKAPFKVARALEGCYKSLGTHAAAVVISNKPFSEGHYPLCRSADNKSLVFAWDMDAVDRLGLLKLDLLGLSTLDVIQDSFDLIKERHGIEFRSWADIPLDDQDTYELLSSGRSVGIFQLEKQLGKTWSKQTTPRNVDQISDLVSVIRPGPLESGMGDIYRDVKRGERVPAYVSPKLKPILDPTYGALLYQEQVIYICQQLAGMNLVDADMVRKAMGKKKPEEMKKWQQVFIDGCKANGTGGDEALEIWGWIEKFAGYGFNKSHGVGYALLAYFTAYLKANYPVEFFCACLRNANFAQDTATEVNKFVNDAKLFGITVTPPSVRKGNTDFDVIDDKTIAFGLGTLKGVGEKAIGPVRRAFQSLDSESYEDFLRASFKHKVNKRVMEALIRSGSMDLFGMSRVQMQAMYDLYSALTDPERNSIPHLHAASIVDAVAVLGDEDQVETIKPLLKEHGIRCPNSRRRETIRGKLSAYKAADLYDGDTQKAGWEQHYLGISLTADETSIFRSQHTVSDVVNFGGSDMWVEIAAKVDAVKVTRTKRGQNPGQEMAFMTLSDNTGQADNFVVFPEPYAKSSSILKVGNILRVRGIMNDRGGVVVRTVEILK